MSFFRKSMRYFIIVASVTVWLPVFPGEVSPAPPSDTKDGEEMGDLAQEMMMQIMQMMQQAVQEMDRSNRLKNQRAFVEDPDDFHVNQDVDGIFFLNRSVELDLDAGQMARLTALRSELQRDAIRLDADHRIAQLELEELLGGDWTLKEAEAGVRKYQKIRGDIQIRYLRAVLDARGVLTDRQLEQVTGP